MKHTIFSSQHSTESTSNAISSTSLNSSAPTNSVYDTEFVPYVDVLHVSLIRTRAESALNVSAMRESLHGIYVEPQSIVTANERYGI